MESARLSSEPLKRSVCDVALPRDHLSGNWVWKRRGHFQVQQIQGCAVDQQTYQTITDPYSDVLTLNDLVAMSKPSHLSHSYAQ